MSNRMWFEDDFEQDEQCEDYPYADEDLDTSEGEDQ